LPSSPRGPRGPGLPRGPRGPLNGSLIGSVELPSFSRQLISISHSPSDFSCRRRRNTLLVKQYICVNVNLSSRSGLFYKTPSVFFLRRSQQIYSICGLIVMALILAYSLGFKYTVAALFYYQICYLFEVVSPSLLIVCIWASIV